jgi:hypothetical protein
VVEDAIKIFPKLQRQFDARHPDATPA